MSLTHLILVGKDYQVMGFNPLVTGEVVPLICHRSLVRLFYLLFAYEWCMILTLC